MSARTTGNMIDALVNAERGIKGIDDNLSEVMPPSTVDQFREAMRLARVEPSRADEYHEALTNAAKRIREDLDHIKRELGAAQHIIHAGVHKANPRHGGHLVL